MFLALLAHLVPMSAGVGGSIAVGALVAARRQRRTSKHVTETRRRSLGVVSRAHLRPRTTAADESGATAFIDDVAELPRHAWLTIGDEALDTRNDAARTSAHQELARVLTDPHLIVAAWYVRDAARTAASLARCAAEHEQSGLIVGRSRELQRRRASRAVVEAAALALLVRARLEPETFDALYAPVVRHLTSKSAGAA